MIKLNIYIILFISYFLISGCQTVKEKTDKIIETENKKLTQYIGKSSEKLKLDLGIPDEDYKNLNGNLELVYKAKKYGILCERKFEISSESIVIGFVSKGCF
jgi:hypothetical protein|tara:strand:+ start:158 stop:463 length:306 start_codon:yes stop_codon:yes gene_type:complete